MKILRILLIDDDPDDRILTLRELKKEFEVRATEIIDKKSLNDALKDFQFDIVITDYQLKWSDGLKILKEIKDQYPDCPVIMFTGTGNEEIAVEAMKAGLDDYVVKSLKHFVRIPVAVRIALDRTQEHQWRLKAEGALHESDEKFRNIFESSPNAITVSSLDGKIIECNQAMLDLHGFSAKEEIIGASTLDLIAEIDHDRIQENMKITMKEGAVRNIEYTFRTKEGLEFPGEISTGIITDLVGNPLSYVALTKDITERKRTEEEMKRRLMKFRIEDGRLYLVKESVPSLSYEALKDLLKIGYHGFVISRTPEQDFKRIFINNNFEFLWLAEKGGNNNTNTLIKEIEAKIEKLPTKNTVFIDRVDYLIFKKGFKKTLAFVQHLREFAYLFGNIIILSIDPSTLTTQELRLLEKEGSEIEPRIDLKKMPEEYFNILKFVYQENITGIRPSYYNVGQEIGISKPTVRKRIYFLLSNGYILENTRGRNKVLELSEMGRNLFYN